MALLFAWSLARGNPSQRVDKLFKMMNDGMAGGEDSFAFDKIYTVCAARPRLDARAP